MFVGTAWNNGSHKMSGAGYGIKLNPRDRDRYFRKPKAFLRLEGQAGDISVNTDKPSFWNYTCRELISKDIGLWLISNNKAPWVKGHPPKLQLEPVGDRTFKVTILQEPQS